MVTVGLCDLVLVLDDFVLVLGDLVLGDLVLVLGLSADMESSRTIRLYLKLSYGAMAERGSLVGSLLGRGRRVSRLFRIGALGSAWLGLRVLDTGLIRSAGSENFGGPDALACERFCERRPPRRLKAPQKGA